MNPIRWIFGQRSRPAERQYQDRWMIRTKSATVTPAERFARHLCAARNLRLAADRSVIPASWCMHPAMVTKVTGEPCDEGKAYARWTGAFMRWKLELQVGTHATEPC